MLDYNQFYIACIELLAAGSKCQLPARDGNKYLVRFLIGVGLFIKVKIYVLCLSDDKKNNKIKNYGILDSCFFFVLMFLYKI